MTTSQLLSRAFCIAALAELGRGRALARENTGMLELLAEHACSCSTAAGR